MLYQTSLFSSPDYWDKAFKVGLIAAFFLSVLIILEVKGKLARLPFVGRLLLGILALVAAAIVLPFIGVLLVIYLT
ncbi:MAG: hypothetical protein ACREOU_12680 [Candidatus Eiseniibacteriota bacterium]